MRLSRHESRQNLIQCSWENLRAILADMNHQPVCCQRCGLTPAERRSPRLRLTEGHGFICGDCVSMVEHLALIEAESALARETLAETRTRYWGYSFTPSPWFFSTLTLPIQSLESLVASSTSTDVFTGTSLLSLSHLSPALESLFAGTP